MAVSIGGVVLVGVATWAVIIPVVAKWSLRKVRFAGYSPVPKVRGVLSVGARPIGELTTVKPAGIGAKVVRLQ